MLKVLDLFSGIGGFSLGLERTGGFKTIAFCEIDPFCRKVLAKHWPDVPCHEDITKLRGAYVGPVDVICGGFPCQPWSCAGERRGEDDDRHLWPEMARLVGEIRPSWVIGENVAGIVSMGLDDVLDDMEDQGYATWQGVVPAAAVGAPHRRDRVWIVAHAKSEQMGRAGQSWEEDVGIYANANGSRCGARGRDAGSQESTQFADWHDLERRIADAWSSPQPGFCAVDDGLPGRMAGTRRKQQLTALGNAVVPQIPEMIGRAILEALADV